MSGEEPEQAAVIRWCESNPDIWVVKYVATAFGKKGTADLILCIKGRFVAIEMKRPKGGVRSPLQIYERKKILRSGGICEFCPTRELAIALIQEVLDGRK